MLRDLRFALLVLAILVLGIALQFVRPILVLGEVYDPQGRPIAGVLGTSNYRAGAQARAAERGATSFISGCLLCPGLRLRVSAPGFETERIQLSAQHPRDTGDRVAVRRYLFGTVQRLRVTLYPEIEVEISRLESELIFARGEPRIVAALHPDLPDRTSPERLHHEIRRVTRGAQTVAPYFALESDTEAGNAIVYGPLTPGGTPAARWRKPTRARLVLHNLDGGFMFVDPLPGIPKYNGFRETLRRLREAPEAGYESSTMIDFERAHLDGGHFYFYCRFGDRYGKGELTALELHASDPTRLRGHVRIWLNESGGREMPTAY